MIDMHSHILPGVDHGSQSVQMSLMLLDAARSRGVETVVATPHFYLQQSISVEHFRRKREHALDTLRGAMQEKGIGISVLAGAEVNLRYGLSALEVSGLCIEGTDVILLEPPLDKVWPNWVFNEVADIIDRHHLRPLIAHIDRYEQENIVELFRCFPLYAQINAESVVSIFTRRKVMRYLESGIVWALGSDTHRSPEGYAKLERCQKYIGAYLPQITERSRLLLTPQSVEQPIT